METYIGLDVSLASTAICAVSAQGKIVKETTAVSEPEDLVATLKAMPGDVIAVGLEAAPPLAMAISAFDRCRLCYGSDGDAAGEGCAESDAHQDGPSGCRQAPHPETLSRITRNQGRFGRA